VVVRQPTQLKKFILFILNFYSCVILIDVNVVH
jgi:hypothetical protein